MKKTLITVGKWMAWLFALLFVAAILEGREEKGLGAWVFLLGLWVLVMQFRLDKLAREVERLKQP